MSETSGRYIRNDGTPFNKKKPPAETTVQFFVEGIQTFHWKADFIKFCQVLELEADDYADQKYQAFQELVEQLNEFDAETLDKMIDWENPKRNPL